MTANRNVFKTQDAKRWVQAASPKSELSLTLYLKSKEFDATQVKDGTDWTASHPSQRSYLSLKKLQDLTKAEPEAFEIVEAFAKDNNLKVTDKSIMRRTITLTGNIEQWSNALKVPFSIYQARNGHLHLDYDGDLQLPEDLGAHVLSISGLTQGLIKGQRLSQVGQVQHVHADKGYSPQEIEEAYAFPEGDAAGQCIGIIELGGRYSVTDIEQYCELFNRPVPTMVEVGTPPSGNQPSQNDVEVTMDIELAAGLAPKAKLVIYYAQSIAEAIHLAVNDNKNKPSVLSISWAQSEYDTSVADRQQLEAECAYATALGITIVAASGDYGSYNGKSFPNVMLPASNPNVIGCGGTALHLPSGYEPVWFNPQEGVGSGGGYSAVYGRPDYQSYALTTYALQHKNVPDNLRGVPDVAANAAMTTAYTLVVNGEVKKMGSGTSAATPVVAALIARLNNNLGYRLGSLHQLLYEWQGTGVFKQVTNGNNGLYPAAAGWNPATGLGVIRGQQFEAAIQESIPGKEDTEEDPK